MEAPSIIQLQETIRSLKQERDAALAQVRQLQEAQKPQATPTEAERESIALRKSEERYRALFESIDEGFCVFKMLFDANDEPVDYRFLETNPAFEQHTGLVDAVGRTARELVPGLEHKWFEIYGRIALTGQPERLQEYSERLGRWFDLYAFRIGEPEQRHVALLFTDVSERKQAEQALRESENVLREVLDTLPVGVFILDGEGNIIQTNPAVWEIWGGAKYVDKENFHLYKAWWADSGLRIEAGEWAAARAISKGEISIGEVIDIDCFDSSRKTILNSALPLRDQDGKIIGAIAVIQDITARNKAEDALREAKAAAEEASLAKSEFMANMSHEIRTPMTVFMAAIEHLQQIDRDPERRHLLGMAEQSAQRLRNLIDDILDISRIEARKVSIEEKPFNLRKIVAAAVDLFTLPAREKHLRLDTDVTPDTPEMVTGDADKIGQVLINLIGNAVKFTHRGVIQVCVRPRDGFLEFAVADTGIGIPEEKRHLLFQSFSQVDSSFTRKFGGTGLGLAISKGLVELMGGEICVQSREAEGSVFAFTVPLRTAEQIIPAPLAAPSENLNNTAARILLADDEPMIRKMITLMLAQRGLHTDTAESGLQAVEKWRDGEFDVIFMDLQMPDMNGMEATQAIRAKETGGGQRTCIIGLTGHASREIRQQCLDSGMDQVLTKPVKIKDLLSAVDTCF